MSFSKDVKKELSECLPTAKHCMLAELSGIFSHLGRLNDPGGKYVLEIRSENEALLRKCFTLCEKSFNILGGNIVTKDRCFYLYDPEDTEAFARGLKLPLHSDGRDIQNIPADMRLLRHQCCQRAYLRGCFLAAGSMSDPQRGYHLEFVCAEERCAKQLVEVMASLHLEARTGQRKGKFIVYLKEGAGIVELLGIMGAHRSLMELENLRILKEMRGSINRRVNCETANITKTVSASSKQTEDIVYIRDTIGISKLPASLQVIALKRLEHPDIPLKDLGALLDPPLGKSGVNHRFRKLSDIAESIKSGTFVTS